jgi:hypothetical protein
MRLGRIILLASLAQILGFPALVAALSEHPALTKSLRSSEEGPAWKSFLASPATDATLSLSSHERTSSHAFLAVTALADTPLRHSVWMVAPAIRTAPVPRPQRLLHLRC